jgi:hypothetical protein
VSPLPSLRPKNHANNARLGFDPPKLINGASAVVQVLPHLPCPHTLGFISSLRFSSARINEDEDPSIQWLTKLESSLVWEIRSLGMVVLGCVALPFSNAAAEVITGLASVVVVLMVRPLLLAMFSLQPNANLFLSFSFLFCLPVHGPC